MRVVAITLVLMAGIGLGGYFTLEVLRWPKALAGAVVIGGNLLLTAILLRVAFGPFSVPHQGFDKDGPPWER